VDLGGELASHGAHGEHNWGHFPCTFEDMALFGVRPCLSVGLVMYFVPIVVFMVFARFNGKIIAKNLKSGYDCEWKEDSWVPAYYALAVLTMLWSGASGGARKIIKSGQKFKDSKFTLYIICK